MSNEAALTPSVSSLPAALDDKKRVPSRMATGGSTSGKKDVSQSVEEYRQLLKLRRQEAAKPKHTVVMMDEADSGLANRISSGMINNTPSFNVRLSVPCVCASS